MPRRLRHCGRPSPDLKIYGCYTAATLPGQGSLWGLLNCHLADLFLFVTDTPSSASVRLSDLRLGTAHALVARSLGSEQALHEQVPLQYLQNLIDGLCELSLKDPLTGLANRRHAGAVLEREIDRVARSGEAALLLMVDIDHFKRVNDSHGHLAGDIVIQTVARTLDACVRPMDTVARYGGEEFAIVLPACQFGFGRVAAERIRRAIESTPIRISPTLTLNITVSVGGAFALQWIRSTTTLWIDRADAELYKAKLAGRNRVSIEEQPDSSVSAEEKSLLFGPLYTPSGWGDLPSTMDSSTGGAL